ncbi:MAG: flagellar motor protein MotA [Rhodospirillales bacterium]|nr:MAG: flagellar motor protein MotA [Rhodospirillales bacterium]
MTRPRRYLLRMLLFLLAVAGVAWVLRGQLITTFWHNPVINGAILTTLVLGIAFIVRQVLSLEREVEWLDTYRRDQPPTSAASRLRLLAPMATMLGERSDKLKLSPMATRSLLDGIASRLDESRETSRYAIGLLIFLGLLGTFWGLLDTVGTVGEAIAGLQVGGDSLQMFAKLKSSLEGPLKGMGTAFGASLFGLSGSLVVGFLELQAGQAQNRFYNDLEDWLAAQTRIGGGALQMDGDQPLPAYVEALLEQSAESIDRLQRTMQRAEEVRASAGDTTAQLGERLLTLTDALRQQQETLARLAANGAELREGMAWLAERAVAPPAPPLVDEESRAHQRSLEAQLARLVEETARARAAPPVDDASRAHQRTLEAQLARLVEETARARAMPAAAPDEAQRAHQRAIEAQLARLVEEMVRGRTALADELRDEFKLLARTLAARSAGEARAAEAPRAPLVPRDRAGS